MKETSPGQTQNKVERSNYRNSSPTTFNEYDRSCLKGKKDNCISLTFEPVKEEVDKKKIFFNTNDYTKHN